MNLFLKLINKKKDDSLINAARHSSGTAAQAVLQVGLCTFTCSFHEDAGTQLSITAHSVTMGCSSACPPLLLLCPLEASLMLHRLQWASRRQLCAAATRCSRRCTVQHMHTAATAALGAAQPCCVCYSSMRRRSGHSVVRITPEAVHIHTN